MEPTPRDDELPGTEIPGTEPTPHGDNDARDFLPAARGEEDAPAQPIPRRASPRSAAEPMAFTRAELARGVIMAGTIFALATPTLAIIVFIAIDPGHAMFAVYLVLTGWILGVVPATALAGFAVAPIADRIAQALRREPRHWPHLLSHAALGAVAAVVMSALVGALIGATSWSGDALGGMTFALPFGAMLAPVAAASAACGWRFTARRALADDESG